MQKQLVRTLAIAAGIALGGGAAQAAQLVASYTFDNTFAADTVGAPALTPLNGGSFITDTVFGQSRTVYERSSASVLPELQSALRLDTTSLALAPDDYAVQIVFSVVDHSNAYRRVVNGYDPATPNDAGLYVGPSNQLNLYNLGPNIGSTALSTGPYYDVVLSVAPGGERAYLDGGFEVAIGTTPDRIQGHTLSFFVDDASEYANGRVAMIRVFKGALSDAEVLSLHNGGDPFTAAVPEPETYAMLLAGLGVLGAVARSRRRSAHR